MSTVSPPDDIPGIATTRPWRWVRSALVADGRVTLTGPGALSGVVRVAGAPAARAVEIFDETTFERAAATTSDATTGEWTLPGLTVSRPLRAIVRGGPGERDVTIRGLYAEVP